MEFAGTCKQFRRRASALQRDRLRAERRREREKEYRLERAGKSVEDDNTEEELKKKTSS